MGILRLDRKCRAFLSARLKCEQVGGRILIASPQSRRDAFPRCGLDELF